MRILPDGAIDIRASLDPAGVHASRVACPTEAVQVLREWLRRSRQHGQAAIDMVLLADERTLGTFVTRTPSLALYWAAAALGQAWKSELRPSSSGTGRLVPASGRIARRGSATESFKRRKGGDSEGSPSDDGVA
jgi:hypothetical protein